LVEGIRGGMVRVKVGGLEDDWAQLSRAERADAAVWWGGIDGVGGGDRGGDGGGDREFRVMIRDKKSRMLRINTITWGSRSKRGRRRLSKREAMTSLEAKKYSTFISFLHTHFTRQVCVRASKL